MRKATMIATALIAVLALSVGAFAYPMVVGTHSLSTVHSGTPATVSHPKTADNSTDNETNDNQTSDHQAAANEHENETAENETSDHEVAPFGNETNETENESAPSPPAPEANETENETEIGNISVEHNVTVAHDGNVTWINGTIIVDQGNTTLVEITFQVVAHDNGTANVTIDGSQMDGSTLVSVHGLAFLSGDYRSVDVLGEVKATQNGVEQWDRGFGFEVPLAG